MQRSFAGILGATALTLVAAYGARAACNLIPSTPDRFVSVTGAANRPFAGPGETLEIMPAPADCERAPAGFPTDDTGAYTVSVVVDGERDGTKDWVVLSENCASLDAALEPCRASESVGRVVCAPANVDGRPVDFGFVEYEGTRVMNLRFPDVDNALARDSAAAPATGRTRIVVTAAAEPPACTLASQTCAATATGTGSGDAAAGDAASGASRPYACIDELYAEATACADASGAAHAEFTHFTSLPAMNDYRALLSSADGSGAAYRATYDGQGNALIPIDWRAPLPAELAAAGVEREQRGSLVVRSLIASGELDPADLDRRVTAYTLWGRRLPRIFVAAEGGRDVTLFGAIDVPLTVVRLAPEESL